MKVVGKGFMCKWSGEEFVVNIIIMSAEKKMKDASSTVIKNLTRKH